MIKWTAGYLVNIYTPGLSICGVPNNAMHIVMSSTATSHCDWMQRFDLNTISGPELLSKIYERDVSRRLDDLTFIRGYGNLNSSGPI